MSRTKGGRWAAPSRKAVSGVCSADVFVLFSGSVFVDEDTGEEVEGRGASGGSATSAGPAVDLSAGADVDAEAVLLASVFSIVSGSKTRPNCERSSFRPSGTWFSPGAGVVAAVSVDLSEVGSTRTPRKCERMSLMASGKAS